MERIWYGVIAENCNLIPETIIAYPMFWLNFDNVTRRRTFSLPKHIHTHTVYFSLHLIKNFLDKIAFSLLNHSTLFSLYTLYTTTQPIAFDLIFSMTFLFLSLLSSFWFHANICNNRYPNNNKIITWMKTLNKNLSAKLKRNKKNLHSATYLMLCCRFVL